MDVWVPETHYASDERAVARALREYDDELRLVPQPTSQGLAYQVRRWCGGDRPSEFLFFWADQYGNALPLSMRLLDHVKEHDRNTQSRRLDADARNALKQAAEDKGWSDDIEALASDWAAKHGRPVLPRSQSLRMSRDKQRARGEKV